MHVDEHNYTIHKEALFHDSKASSHSFPSLIQMCKERVSNEVGGWRGDPLKLHSSYGPVISLINRRHLGLPSTYLSSHVVLRSLTLVLPSLVLLHRTAEITVCTSSYIVCNKQRRVPPCSQPCPSPSKQYLLREIGDRTGERGSRSNTHNILAIRHTHQNFHHQAAPKM